MNKTASTPQTVDPVNGPAALRGEPATRFLVIHSPEGVAHSLELQAGRAYRLGRSEANDLTLKDMQVSSFHARLEPDGEEFVIRDQESRNGTSINGERVRSRHLRVGDRLRLGSTEIDYVKRLDPSELGTSAILSPRLSQPLLRTEVQRLRDLIAQLSVAQQTMELRAPNDAMRQVGHDLAHVAGELWSVENHLRCLICANHFHQLFHTQRTSSELYHDMLRYIASAIEAENAALVFLNGARASVVATIGIATLNWQFRLPEVFQAIIGRAMRENTRYYCPSLGKEEMLASQFPNQLAASDHRSVLVVPIVTPDARQVIGAAYFDNVHNPRQLRPQSSELAEGCLTIYAGYRQKQEISGTQRRSRSQIGVNGNGEEKCEPTLCAE